MNKNSTSNTDALSAEAHGQSNAAATRIDIAYEELSIVNVAHASTLSLLRERERDLHALDTRVRRCATESSVTDFLYVTGEGSGDHAERVRNLQDSVALFVHHFTALQNEISTCRIENCPWKMANRSSGNVVRTMRACSEAVVNELEKRASNNTLVDIQYYRQLTPRRLEVRCSRKMITRVCIRALNYMVLVARSRSSLHRISLDTRGDTSKILFVFKSNPTWIVRVCENRRQTRRSWHNVRVRMMLIRS